MSADLTHLRATLTEHGSLDKSTVLALIDRAETAERQSAHATSALKALAERNIELTEQKRVLNVRFDAMRAGRDSERSRADKNASKLEQAEQAVLRVRELNQFLPASIMERITLALDGDTRRLADQGLGGGQDG